ncbi:hypothetical protein LENED_004879 [Lentinula edodes]|uniref:Uncharacterized protein n=1 Tax=Lentinula edodes TaxID=5353 RepID=A0A1Q3E7G7_LENED|nr:hypothetical protein LENED_004879 [Lentinula edodes]
MRLAPAFIVASIALFTVVHAAPYAATRQTTTSSEEPLASLQTRKDPRGIREKLGVFGTVDLFRFVSKSVGVPFSFMFISPWLSRL